MKRFLQTTLAAVVLAFGFTAPARAATVNFTLYMASADKTFVIPLASATYTRTVWVEGFTNVSGAVPNIGGVTLNANEGDTINITVFNQTQESHDFQINGTSVPKVTIAAGANKVVSFTAPPAGDYIYYDPSNDAQTKQAQRAVGMYGALVIRPAGQLPGAAGDLYVGGPSYGKDYTWVLSDFDKLWNAADKAATAAPAAYKATYAFINGDFGSHSLKNLLNSPKSNVGDTIALRIINPGMIAHPVHFHGYHGEVWVKNNVSQAARLLEKDVLDVPPMTSYDLIFHINQKGIYIIHDHTGMMVTQDGIYAEGMLAEFDTCTKEGGLVNACDKFCPTPSIGVPNCGGGGGGWR